MQIIILYSLISPSPPSLSLLPPPLQWLLKALGEGSATARKAGPIPWSAQVLEQGIGPAFRAVVDPPRIAT